MKKILLLSLAALLLPACADKNQYEQAVLEQMKKEADIKDYKITPEYMAKCVVDTTAKNMPGLFPVDPTRLTAYRNYTKMLTLTESQDPKKVLEELRTDFGSAKALAEARTNYTESLMECYTAVISESEKENAGEAKVEEAPVTQLSAPTTEGSPSK
ncbi:MAG: hypothetical protein D0528_05390 [Methylococcales bacterium]|nr:MAG: hypothetical protein D0528_05390 [Methylococcales bacterium]